MRFSLKLALGILLILTFVLSLYSALFLSRSFDDQMQSHRRECFESLSNVRTSMELTMMAAPDYTWDIALQQTVQALQGSNDITILDATGALVFGSLDDAVFAQHSSEYVDAIMQDEDVMVAVGQLNVYSRRFIIILKHSIQPIYAQQEQFAWFASLLYMGAFLLTALLVFVFANRFTRPIRQISRAVTAYGHGDFSGSLSVKSDDEIGELAHSIGRMAMTIEDQIGELKENAQQKELFVASFSHEIKTPLTSVIGYAEMIRSGKADSETVRLAADYIWNEGMRLEVLSQRLMELLRIRESDILLMDVAAHEFAQDLAQTFPMLFPNQLSVDIVMEDCYLRAEPDLLKTLLINLADNARKADATHFLVRGTATADGYRFTVSDNGKGIPSSELKNMTQLFYQVEKDRSSAKGGVGLGLSLAERIAALHGGTLHFESVVGQGTCITFDVIGVKVDEA